MKDFLRSHLDLQVGNRDKQPSGGWRLWLVDAFVLLIVVLGLELEDVGLDLRPLDWVFYLLGFSWSPFRYLRFVGPSLLHSLRFRSIKKR